MRIRISTIAVFLCCVAVSGLAGSLDDDWQAKVDPWILGKARGAAEAEFLVLLTDQADLSPAEALTTKEEKGRFVVDALRSTAEATQGPVLERLEALGVDHRSYWIRNMIWVRGDADVVMDMARRPDVVHLYANPEVRIDSMPAKSEGKSPDAPRGIEWNIDLVGAPDVWALGVDGDGAVVAGQDTGYRWDHDALIQQYRGGPGGNHDYNWHDAIHSGGGSCGADSPEPCDDHGHGTHTMGTIVGDDGLGNQVGMAPGARWIGCRNMNVGAGTPTTYSECYQFFIAPTDLNGNNPDPGMAPDVINNSWGCPPSEGCTDPNVLLGVVQAVRAAGIVTVHSAGNEGSGCESVQTPSAIYDESFSVAATDSSDEIAYFSSRGPVTVDGSNRMKPDISAPGVDIRSSTRDGGYQGGWNGTSMAGPHVAGMVALVVSAEPGIAGNVNGIENVIAQTAVPKTTTQGCGDDTGTSIPNNVFGWGRIDALAAVNALVDFSITLDPVELQVCAAPATVPVAVSLQTASGFSEPVTLGVSGLPSGVTGAFDPEVVTPPGSSTLSVVTTAGAAAGTYPVVVSGVSAPSGSTNDEDLSLVVFSGPPGAVALTTPPDGALTVEPVPTLVWESVSGAASYLVEVATDAGMTEVMYSADTSDTSHTLGTALDPTTRYWWRVRAENPCGNGAWSPVFDFTTRAIAPILLVDDDDNSADVREFYTDTLDALGLQYEIWDTANSDDEPQFADLGPRRAVIWFTGDEFGGSAGPGSAGETALASWLDQGEACLLLSSMDYFWDRGLTSFMQSHLGVASANSDTGQDTVTGGGTVFAGLGPYSLAYPGSDYSDTLEPNGTGSAAFTGNSGVAGLEVVTGSFVTVFLGFPFEAFPTLADRQAVMARFLDACPVDQQPIFSDGFESGDDSAWS